jgi:7-cyano-7-deazaguanine synthase
MSCAVLVSGGLDSAVLLAEEAGRGDVQPIYVSVGLAWEEAERAVLDRLLATDPRRSVRPLVTLSVDMRDTYAATHWAIEGHPPAYHTPDEDVYLPGRNLILLGKTAVFCAAANLGRITLGTLDHNPFPDASPAFLAAMAAAVSLGLGHNIRIEAPFATLSKADVIRRGSKLHMPLELTLSCMNPAPLEAGTLSDTQESTISATRHSPFRHCGTCSKCRERHDAFLEAGLVDPTDYVDRTYVGPVAP